MAKTTGPNTAPWAIGTREGYEGRACIPDIAAVGDPGVGVRLSLGLLCGDSFSVWESSGSAIQAVLAGCRQDLESSEIMTRWRKLRGQQATIEQRIRILRGRLHRLRGEREELVALVPDDLPRQLAAIDRTLLDIPGEISGAEEELGSLLPIVETARKAAEQEATAAFHRHLVQQRQMAQAASQASCEALLAAMGSAATEAATKLLALRRLMDIQPRDYIGALLTTETASAPAAQPVG